MMKGSDIGIHEKKAKLFNEWEMFTSTDGESIESYYHRTRLMAKGIQTKLLNTNQQQPKNSSPSVIRQIAQPGTECRESGCSRCSSESMVFRIWNQNGQMLYPGITKSESKWRIGILLLGTYIRPRRKDDAYLQTPLLIAQKEEAGIQLQAEDFDLMAAADLDEIEERGGTVDQHPATVEETRAYFESLYNNLALEVEKINSVNSKMKETNADLITELARYKNQETCFEILSEQVDTTKGTSTNTKFANQSTERKPSLQPVRKNLDVRQPNASQSEHTTSSKNRIPQKVDEMNDLSKPVTSNSVPAPQESKSVKHDNVIAPGMFRVNPFKPSREETYVPTKVRASVRTNTITVSQPHVVTKKDVNSDSNGLSSTGVDNTAKTRRPQPRSNTKNDRVPSASKSSCNKNKEVEVEEHHRNLLLSKNKKHMSSECKHVKLDTRNDKYEVSIVLNVFLVAKTKGQKTGNPPSTCILGSLFYPKNDREDIRKLGAKGDIGFFIAISYGFLNKAVSKPASKHDFWTKSFRTRSYLMPPSTITTQKPTEGELDLPFEAMYDDYIGGQPFSAPRTALAAQAPPVLQTPTATTTTADTSPTLTNSSSQATIFPNTS
ncbi:hypothetical protein Tco_0332685 [Tanacetum coccineum]